MELDYSIHMATEVTKNHSAFAWNILQPRRITSC